jgi:dTMP kinase
VREARETAAGRGWLVTIEGPDGSGKTLHARRLFDLAVGSGVPVVLAREPGGTAAGERIREIVLVDRDVRIDPRADALLFSAARAQHVSEIIEPALAEGRLVVCDRFADSTLAYQGYGRGLPIDELAVLQHFATAGLRPDLTILLDLPAEVGLARKQDAEQLRFEAAFDVDFHRRVREGFLELARAEPDRFAVVDATGDEDRVFAAVSGALGRLPDLATALGLAGPRDGPPHEAPVDHTRASEPNADPMRTHG